MGEAKHRRSRCTCSRIGPRHEDGCPALTPPARIENFVIGLDKAFAAELNQAHAREIKEGAPHSTGTFLVSLMKIGLHVLETTRKKEEERGSLVKVATPEQQTKLAESLLGGR